MSLSDASKGRMSIADFAFSRKYSVLGLLVQITFRRLHSGFTLPGMLNYTENGLWLSLVERLVRDQEAVGSNPTSPITAFLL
jgi:hypothetical protein